MKKNIQTWKRLGLIFKTLNLDWSKTHSMLPTPFKLNRHNYRIFFGTRNIKNQSSIGFFDFDFKNFKIKNKSKKKSFDIGELGSFDDNGVLPSSIIKHNNKTYLFYIGWKPGGSTRYSLIAGIAKTSNKGINFNRIQKYPILKLSDREPYSILTAPHVIKIKNNKFYMWYVSCEKWLNKDFPLYNIKLATSKNLINWNQVKKVCIKLRKNERAVARPFVLKENNIFKMWYSYEKLGETYKIGYAESKNGIKWKRLDNKIKFTVEVQNWEKDMMAYSTIITANNKKFMLYNGNNYGKSGIGVAELINN